MEGDGEGMLMDRGEGNDGDFLYERDERHLPMW